MGTNTSEKTMRDWVVFRRSDFIATKIVRGIAVAGSVLFGVCGPVLAAVNNAPLPMSYTTAVLGGIELPRGAIQDGNATMQVLVTGASPTRTRWFLR